MLEVVLEYPPRSLGLAALGTDHSQASGARTIASLGFNKHQDQLGASMFAGVCCLERSGGRDDSAWPWHLPL
jgi:hypothetical protein